MSANGKVTHIFKDLEELYNYRLSSLKLLGFNDTVKLIDNDIVLCGINNRNLVSYKVPNFITKLSDKCFISCCSSLRRVYLPDSVVSLGNECFKYCNYLEEVKMTDSVQELGFFCFRDCSSLRGIALSNSITELPNFCFVECTSLESIRVPDSVEKLGNFCF